MNESNLTRGYLGCYFIRVVRGSVQQMIFEQRPK